MTETAIRQTILVKFEVIGNYAPEPKQFSVTVTVCEDIIIQGIDYELIQ